ncbi:MAG TPA: MBL fold metallo-hydrolase [Geobacteraceae bacterium]|nr:MBL fold metallo-hydrolase [Geobacteraceae bacterium]
MKSAGKIRITILCENSVGPISGTLGEHGFAALVEGERFRLLFDTGQGETLLRNAMRMNRDLHGVGKVALSHGHHDHTGGLLPLLRNCGGKEVYAHPAIFSRRYRVKDTGESSPIGIPYEEAYLRGMGASFNFFEGFREIERGLFLTGEVPRRCGFEKGDAGLCCDASGCVPDPVPDDQSLVILGEKGLVLLLGCCHAGLVNTIRHAMEQTGISEIHALIGGTHLGFCPPAQTEETIKALREYRIRKICGSHCTGFSASARLTNEFPGVFQYAQVGYTLEL